LAPTPIVLSLYASFPDIDFCNLSDRRTIRDKYQSELRKFYLKKKGFHNQKISQQIPSDSTFNPPQNITIQSHTPTLRVDDLSLQFFVNASGSSNAPSAIDDNNTESSSPATNTNTKTNINSNINTTSNTTQSTPSSVKLPPPHPFFTTGITKYEMYNLIKSRAKFSDDSLAKDWLEIARKPIKQSDHIPSVPTQIFSKIFKH
jgi:hypothetical protein